MSGVLVTGTDTGVGKTWVTCRLAEALVESGLRVGVMKPCETGVIGGPRPRQLPEGSDAELLVRASGCAAAPEHVLPYALRMPAAPSAAALAEDVTLDLDEIDRAYGELAREHDVVLVEGAGGLLVPLVGTTTFVDLARRLELPVLIVARSRLGTLNHSSLTERAARAAGLEVLGIVVDDADGAPSESERANLAELPSLVDAPLLGHLELGARRAPDALVAAVRAVAL